MNNNSYNNSEKLFNINNNMNNNENDFNNNKINENDYDNFNFKNYNNNKTQIIKNLNYEFKINFFKNFIETFTLDELTFKLLLSIKPALNIIYTLYFIKENSNYFNINKINSVSEKNFIKFNKEFNVIPYIMNKFLLDFYYQFTIQTDNKNLINNENLYEKMKKNFDYKKIIENNNNNNNYNQSNKNFYLPHNEYNQNFTFIKFVLFFPHISSYYFNEIKDKSNAEKLLYFLQKIYISEGYKNLYLKLSKNNNKKYSIIPNKKIIQLINENLLEDNSTVKKRKNIIKNNSCNKIDNNLNLKDFLELNDENYNNFLPYLNKLKNLFEIYSQFGDKFKFGKMSFSNLHKMLNNGGLLFVNEKQLRKNKSVNSSREINNSKNNIYNNSSSFTFLKSNFQQYNNNISLNTINTNNKNIFNNNNNKISRANSQPNLKKSSNFSNINNSSNDSKFYLNSMYLIPRNKISLSELNVIVSKLSGIINYKDLNNDNKLNLTTTKILNYSTKRKNFLYHFDFNLFLKVLIEIAIRLFPTEPININFSFKKFLEKNFQKFFENINQITKSYSETNEVIKLFNFISSNEQLIQLIKDIHPCIQGHYFNYCDNKTNKLDFNGFVSFFKDFGIFPFWITMLNLKEIFFSQVERNNNNNNKENCNNNSKINNNNNNNKENIKDEININNFLECFVTIAVCMNSGDDFNWIDKVLFLLDKMFINGGDKSMSKNGKPFSSKYDFKTYEKNYLRKKYPNYYKKKFNTNLRFENLFLYQPSQ